MGAQGAQTMNCNFAEGSYATVERSGLAGHHFVNVPLAHKDGKDPDTLNKVNLKSLLVHSSKLEL